MQQLSFARSAGEPLTLLCLGAHADDIEIGCGGTLLTLLARHPGSRVVWVVFSAPGPRRAEALASAAAFLRDSGPREVRALEFEESVFPYQGAAIKQAMEELKSVAPDVVLTHHLGDRHQDHRLVAELTWNSFRDHLVLEYEIPKYEGDLGAPNVFVPMDAERCREKCRLLRTHFPSQHSRHWFDDEVFLGLARLRGLECRAPGGYAEAFHGRKLVIG